MTEAHWFVVVLVVGDNFLEVANLSSKKQKIPGACSKKELIKDFQQFVYQQDRVPSLKEYPKADVVRHHFETWAEFLSIAGFDEEIVSKGKYTDEVLFKEIRKLSRLLGRPPYPSEYERQVLAIKRFGTWTAFLLSAEIPKINQ